MCIFHHSCSFTLQYMQNVIQNVINMEETVAVIPQLKRSIRLKLVSSPMLKQFFHFDLSILKQILTEFKGFKATTIWFELKKFHSLLKSANIKLYCQFSEFMASHSLNKSDDTEGKKIHKLSDISIENVNTWSPYTTYKMTFACINRHEIPSLK